MTIPMSAPTQLSQDVSYEAVILAGGRGQRMGGVDKGLQVWRGQPLVDHVLARLRAQTQPPTNVFISANRNVSAYGERAQVVKDGGVLEGGVREDNNTFQGPLYGIEAALAQCRAPYLLVVPCDSPCLPSTLARSLVHCLLEAGDAQQGQVAAACAVTDGQIQPLTCLLRTDSLESLRSFLEQGGRRALTWLQEIGLVPVVFEDAQAFVNFNRLSDLSA